MGVGIEDSVVDGGVDSASSDGFDAGVNATIAEVGVVDFITTAGHWGGSVSGRVEVKDLSVAALLVGSEVTFLSAAAVTALDLASVVGLLLLLLLVFLGFFGFLDLSDLLGTTWNGAARALASAADLVAWVVQGFSVISAAFEADGWVDVVDGLGTASLAVDIDLGGSTASGLHVGVVVVEGEIVSLVDDLTAWAGLLGGIEDVEVVSDVAFIGGVDV